MKLFSKIWYYLSMTILILLYSTPVYASGAFSTAFQSALMPHIIDFGKVVFWCCCCYGAYYIMRRQVNEGVDRIKYACFGYIALRLMNGFTDLIDKIATDMVF